MEAGATGSPCSLGAGTAGNMAEKWGAVEGGGCTGSALHPADRPMCPRSASPSSRQGTGQWPMAASSTELLPAGPHPWDSTSESGDRSRAPGTAGGRAGRSPELPGLGTREQWSAVRVPPARLWALTAVSAGWQRAPQWGALVLCKLTFQVWPLSRFSGEGMFASPQACPPARTRGLGTTCAHCSFRKWGPLNAAAPWSPGSTGHLEAFFLLPWRYGRCVSTQTRPSVLHG